MKDINVLVCFRNVLNEVKKITEKTNKYSVLIIQQQPSNTDSNPFFPMIRESLSNIIAFVCVSNEYYIEDIIAESRGVIDAIILDNTRKRENSDNIIRVVNESSLKNNLKLFVYSDFDTWASSAVNFLEIKEQLHFSNKRILLVGRNYLATRVLLKLIDFGVAVYLNPLDYPENTFPYIDGTTIQIESSLIKWVKNEVNYDILLGCSIFSRYSNISQMKLCKFQSIYDIGIGNFDINFLSEHRTFGCNNLFRSDDRTGISSIVLGLMETDYLIKHSIGRKTICGINLVSGGSLGLDGDIVVDNIEDPEKIIGVANGEGGFKKDLSKNDLKNIEIIQSII